MLPHRSCLPVPVVSVRLLLAGFLIAGVSLPAPAATESGYVSDQLVVNLRSDVDQASESVATVRTGERLDIVEARDHYVRVRTDSGAEGWIAARYVETDLPKSRRIQVLEEEIAVLEDTVSALRAQGGSAGTGPGDSASPTNTGATAPLLETIETLTKENSVLKERLQATERQDETDAVLIENLVNERNLLLQQVEMGVNRPATDLDVDHEASGKQPRALGTEAESLSRGNARLEGRQRMYWFVAGGFVFFSGLLTGKVSGRRKKRFVY